MTPKTINGILDLCSKSFSTHVSGQLLVLWSKRTSHRRSQQRVTKRKGGRIWSLWRPQLYEINEFEETVYEVDVARDIKRKLRADDVHVKGHPLSKLSRTSVVPMVRSRFLLLGKVSQKRARFLLTSVQSEKRCPVPWYAPSPRFSLSLRVFHYYRERP